MKSLIFIISFSFFLNIISYSQSIKKDSSIIASDSNGIITLSIDKKYLKDSAETVLKKILKLNKEYSVTPREYSILDKQTEQFLIKQYDSNITIFGILISVIISVFGIIQFLNSRRLNKEMDDIKSQYKESINIKKDLDSKFDNLKNGLKFDDEIRNIKAKNEKEIPKLVEEKISKLFEEKYQQQIFDNTRKFSDEVLMQTDEARDISLTFFRNRVNQIHNIFSKGMTKKEFSSDLNEILQKTVQDWHTLNQIYSINKEILQRGLSTLATAPFIEARTKIERLKVVYYHDSDIFPIILDCIKAIENMITKK
jgi:hypothetical protein